MRKFGQEIIKTLGGKKVHPWHSIPGGSTGASAWTNATRS
jgi:coenzyme F420-reducing hydrogenase alpha subunit